MLVAGSLHNANGPSVQVSPRWKLRLYDWGMARCSRKNSAGSITRGRGEYAENHFRKAFTPSEQVAIAEALEPIERAKAKERQGTRNDILPENFSGSSAGKALDHVAKAAGGSRPTLAKAKAVVDAAKADPQQFGAIKDKMDATGKVDPAYKLEETAK